MYTILSTNCVNRFFKLSLLSVSGLPGQPQNVKLNVTSDSSLCVRFDAPEGTNGAVVTRYKGERKHSNAGNFFINLVNR